MAFRISELPAGTPPYLGTALLEVSVANPGAPSGFDSRKALLFDIAAAVGDLLPAPATFAPGGVLYGHTDGTPVADVAVLKLDPATHELTLGADVKLARGAANRLELRNGTTPQAARIYRTWTDASNGEWAYLGSWLSDFATYGTGMVGTGAIRDFSWVRGGAQYMRSATSAIIVGSPDVVTTMQIQLRGYRVGSAFNGAALNFGGARSDTADGADHLGRGFVVLPGNSANTTSSLFVGAQSAIANVIGDAAALRLNASSIEIQGGGWIDLWASNVNYARLRSNAASWVAAGSSALFGVANTAPAAVLSVGTVAATAYTSNLATTVSDYERALIGNWASDVAQYGTVAAGTGAARDVSLVRGGVELLRLGTTGVETAGRVWVSRTNPSDDGWSSVAYGNGLFVAVAAAPAAGGRVMTSPDGVNWTARTAAATNNWTSVAYGNGLFVAVASSGTGNRVMTSPDGITWTSRTSAADNVWQSVTYGKGLFVAVSNTGTGTDFVMTSPDGTTWTIRTAATANTWRGVCFGNGLFVAVSNSGTGNRVMSSPDGITWTTRTSAVDSNWLGVCYGNGLFVAVANTGASIRAMTSPDGISWTGRTIALNAWVSVSYGDGTFVAVATSGTNRIATSPDGINWTARTAPVDSNAWTSVAFGNGVIAAVSNGAGAGNRVMSSGAQRVANLGLGG